jgi:hypothetical protein
VIHVKLNVRSSDLRRLVKLQPGVSVKILSDCCVAPTQAAHAVVALRA